MTISRPNLPTSIMNSNTAEREFDSLPLLVVSGALPADLQGHMFVVAPAGTSDQPTPGISTGDEIWVFKADDLHAGPICKLVHPDLNFGFTLHTAWMPQIQPIDATQLTNIIPVREDFVNRVADKSETIKNLFEEIYRKFETP